MLNPAPARRAEPVADPIPARAKRQRPKRDTLLGFVLILPAMALVIAVLIYPTLFNLGISLRAWNWSDAPGADKPFVGLDNYLALINSARFWNSFRVTITLVIAAIIVQYLLGLLLALMLNKKFHGQKLFRAIFVLPMILAPIVIGIQWRYLLSGSFGVINYVLGVIGVAAPRWLSDPKLGLPILIMVDTWTWLPFVTLILLAGLQQVPQEVLEAAEVDGAGYLRRLWHIILPMLGPSTVIVLLMRSTEIFRAFDVPYVLTGGGPGRTTEVLGMLLYRTAFVEGNLGTAAALSVIIGVVGMAFGTILIRAIRTEVRLF